MNFGIILLFIASGSLSGLLAGLLGIGGGIVTVPILYYSLQYANIPENAVMQVAVSTSLASAFFTSFVSSWAHNRKKAIQFTYLKYLIPGLFLGSLTGAITVNYLSSYYLKIAFGIMAILLGIYLFFPRLPLLNLGTKPNSGLTLSGIVIGALSTLFGIGGGVFTVPVLFSYNLPTNQTVATSSASTMATTLFGSIAFLFIAWDRPSLPETVGFIEVPAFLLIAFSSILLVPLGVRLSRVLPTVLIRRIFACALAITGACMIYR